MKEEIEIPIIWRDESLLVINKPAGMLTVADGHDPDAPHLKVVLVPQYGPLWIVHRLDRHTSGVILMARSADAHRRLNTQFQERQVKKIYHALVLGNPNWEHQTVDLPLRVNAGRRHRTVVDHQNGKSAVTSLQVLERFENSSLIEAAPQSGRRHQIRAHLAEVGCPIVADGLYGRDRQKRGSIPDNSFLEVSRPGQPHMNRTALHAWSIAIHHPDTNQLSVFTAPYPEDFGKALNTLRSNQE
jgi:RluA family pseudouridine synthase